ncbi:MAG: guanylate kinase [Desulfobacterales bacterium]
MMASKRMSRRRAQLFIISAPSGAGKTTLAKAVLERYADLLYSVSFTTRKPRAVEQDGVDYHFISKHDFEKGIKEGHWAEWAEVYGNYYGTSGKFIDNGLSSGRDILLDIDVQGTIQILKKYPDSVTIFILPPSMKTLKKRLEMRGTDSRQVIERRLVYAKNEMAQKDLYRHIIVNDNLSKAIEELSAILKKYRQ